MTDNEEIRDKPETDLDDHKVKKFNYELKDVTIPEEKKAELIQKLDEVVKQSSLASEILNGAFTILKTLL